MAHVLIKHTLLIGALSLTVVGSALAEPNIKAQEARNSQVAAQDAGEVKRAEAKLKSADAKLKACQKREATINKKMLQIVARGERQIAIFTQIADRTQAFYTAKGKTLSNYAELVAEVENRKNRAQSALDQMKSHSGTFICDATDPKAVTLHFKESLKREIEALKLYKTAVKNLIVGVKSVQGSTASTEGTSSGARP